MMKKRIAALSLCLIILLCSLGIVCHAFSISTVPLTSLEAYHDYIAELRGFLSLSSVLPKGFVDWETVSVLGTFQKFHFGLPYQYEHYEYTFTDSQGGFAVSISIDHNANDDSSDWYNNFVEVTNEMDTMAVLPESLRNETTRYAKIHCDSYEYWYYNWKLTSIVWKHNGIQYAVYIHDPSQVKGNSCIARLLSVDRGITDAAITELKLKLTSPIAGTSFAICVVLCLGITAIVLLKKKKILFKKLHTESQ